LETLAEQLHELASCFQGGTASLEKPGDVE
jgi:hypothetical protein